MNDMHGISLEALQAQPLLLHFFIYVSHPLASLGRLIVAFLPFV